MGVFEAVFESVIQVSEIYKGGSIKQFNCRLWIELCVRSLYRGQEKERNQWRSIKQEGKAEQYNVSKPEQKRAPVRISCLLNK